MHLTFEEGTLLLRVDLFRAQAHFYRESLNYLKRERITFKNTAPRYQTLSLIQQSPPHQSESITAWIQHGRRGGGVLPTSSGKSQVPPMAILEVQRSTLIFAPTIDLMNQWYNLLSKAFAIDVGLLGGGYHEIEGVTVATYDSAYMRMERLGNRFGLIVFDEVHHLPGEMYSHAAEMCIPPQPLGANRPPGRADGRHVLLDTLIGAVTNERGIRELSGEYLAEYRVERRQLQMVAEERVQYEAALHEYQSFLRDKNIRLGSANGWRNFVMLSAKSTDARRAMHAYRHQCQIGLGTTAKIRVLEEILKAHLRDRVLIFTNDNETVHEISRT